MHFLFHSESSGFHEFITFLLFPFSCPLRLFGKYCDCGLPSKGCLCKSWSEWQRLTKVGEEKSLREVLEKRQWYNNVHAKRWKTQGLGGVVGKEDPVCRFQ